MRISVDVNDHGGLAVGARLTRIGGRAGNLQPASEAVHQQLMRAIDYQYGRNAPAIGGWRPASPQWVARKAQLGLDIRTMHATRRLRISLTNKASEDHVFRATRSGLVISTRVPYAKHLADGGRPPVVISEAAAKKAADLIRDYILSD